MKSKTVLAGCAAAALAVSGLATLLPTATAAGSAGMRPTVRACAARPAPGQAACQAIAVATPAGHILRSSHPLATGFTPDDIQKAYGLKGLKSHGATVAIVDAYGYPTLESDLATFRSQYGLPACTIKNGCLQIMDQHGGSNLPPTDSGWDLEQALDVDAVSSACPDCNIIVVQAKSASLHNLAIAVTQAYKHHPAAISNSYIGFDRKPWKQFNRPGVAITAATGDGGSVGGQYPADDPHVVAVGGTSVTRDGSKRGYSEAAWSGAGSGCAGKTAMPKWQQSVKTTCKTRAVSDVSAAADPNLGGLNIVINGGWEQVGGTSEATPLIASVYALSGNTKGYPAKMAYAKKNQKYLYDVTSGSNGSCGAPICQAGKGWDGPTGMGTPHGVKAF